MRRRLIIAIFSLSALMFLLIRASSGSMTNPFLDYQNLGIWVGAALTLFALSFLYGDNPFFRFAEHVFVGVTAAYWMVLGFWSTLVPLLVANIVPEVPVYLFHLDTPVDVSVARRLLYCIPLCMGLLLLARLHPRGRPASVLTLAFIMGTTAGLRLIGDLEANFMNQVGNSITALCVVTEQGFSLGRTIDAVFLTGGTLCCLSYFYFSRGQNGALGVSSKVGLWILMVTFGAGFGFTVMGRIALLVGRVEFLLRDWLGII